MISTLSSHDDNYVAMLSMLVKKIQVRFGSFSIKDELLEYSDYPSLLVMSDCLYSWKVPHITCYINKDEIDLKELSYPFVAHLSNDKGRFVLVYGFVDGQILYTDETKSNMVFSINKFLDDWDGILLHPENDEVSGHLNYNDELVKNWLQIFRVPFLIINLIFKPNNINYTSMPYLGHLVIKLFGIVIC